MKWKQNFCDRLCGFLNFVYKEQYAIELIDDYTFNVLQNGRKVFSHSSLLMLQNHWKQKSKIAIDAIHNHKYEIYSSLIIPQNKLANHYHRRKK